MISLSRQGYLEGDVKFPAAPNNTIILTLRDQELLGQNLEGKWVTTLSVYLDSTLLGAWVAVMNFITHLVVKYYVNNRFSPYTTDPVNKMTLPDQQYWSSFNIIIFDNTGQSYKMHLESIKMEIVETLTSQTEYKVEVINGQYNTAPPGAPPVWEDYELPTGSRCMMHSFIEAQVKGEEWAETKRSEDE